MTILLTTDPILEDIQKYFKDYGVQSSLSEHRLDFEADYVDSVFLGTKGGIRNAGSLKLENSPIDYINIIKKYEYEKCDYVAGAHVGMGIHKHSWWKIRFFLSFPESYELGPLNIGTISTVKKGLLHSVVESFLWNGYQKLTTLPPGLIRDNVVDQLSEDQRLRQLMTKCLLNERTITVSRYSPRCVSDTVKTNSKIVISSSWKFQKDLFINHETIEMYERIAEIVKHTVNNLKYHLT